MVTLVKNTGNILNMFGLREITASCLCLRTSKPDEREYKAVVTINPVNFSLLSEGEQESILEGFRSFLARLPVHQALMIHIRIEPYDLQPYIDQLQEARRNASEIIRTMATDHEDFILRLASQRALLQRQFYIVVGAELEKGRGLDRAEVFDRARGTLDLKTKDILQDMERCGLTGHRLDDDELKTYYQSCLHAEYARAFPVPISNTEAVKQPIRSDHPIERDGGTTQPLKVIKPEQPEQIRKTGVFTGVFAKGRVRHHAKKPLQLPAEMRLPELLAPSSIELDRNYIRIHRNTDEYVRGLTVIGYPAIVSAGWLDRLIQIDEPFIDIIMHIEPLDSATYTAKLTRKLTGFNATKLLEERHGRTSDPYIKAARVHVEELRDRLVEQTEKAYGASLYMLVRATNKTQLKERTNKLLSLLKSLELTAVDCSFEHQKTWQTCLPDGRDILRRRKVMDTSSLVTAFPFASSSLSTPTGMLVGVQPNGSLVIIDPKSDLLENGHEVKFARSGAGKSYDEKIRISRSLLAGYEAIVIDPEDEYLPLAQKCQGTTIRLSSGAFQLNPFDLHTISERGDRNVLAEKYESLLTLFDLLLADKHIGVLGQREKAHLIRCFQRAYLEKGITEDATTHQHAAPSLHDLYTILRSGICGQDTYELADRLERHVSSFPTTTTVGLDGQLVVFNIRDLADDQKAIGLFLITDFVWTQVRREKHPRRRLLVIDEAWALLQFPEGGRFLAGISRRARKYNLCLRTITQDVEDFLSSEWGRTILVNSSMKFLMKQDSTTIDGITKAFKLSDGERKYLLGCAKGEGLFFARGSHVPMKVVASRVEHTLATTNAEELLRIAEQQKSA